MSFAVQHLLLFGRLLHDFFRNQNGSPKVKHTEQVNQEAYSTYCRVLQVANFNSEMWDPIAVDLKLAVNS